MDHSDSTNPPDMSHNISTKPRTQDRGDGNSQSRQVDSADISTNSIDIASLTTNGFRDKYQDSRFLYRSGIGIREAEKLLGFTDSKLQTYYLQSGGRYPTFAWDVSGVGRVSIEVTNFVGRSDLRAKQIYYDDTTSLDITIRRSGQ
jgi:hypothetical protein